VIESPALNSPDISHRRRHSGTGRGWWWAAVVVLIPSLIPPATLTWIVASGGIDIGIPAGRLATLFVNTLGLTIAVTATALLIGIATAYLTARTDIPGRTTWMLIAALPLVVPSYVAALTIIAATGSGGVVDEYLGWAIPTPYGFAGSWLALSVFLAPMVHLTLVPALRRIDPSTEEAAIGLGASRLKTLVTVTIPQARPALIAAGLLVGLYTVSDFGAVSLLRFDTFTRAIYTLYVGQIDRTPAIALSLILMVMAVAIILAQRKVTTRATYYSRRPRAGAGLLHLRGWSRGAATFALAAYSFLTLVVPIGVMTRWLLRGLSVGQGAGQFWDETARSVGVALAAAVVGVIAAFPVAMVTARIQGRASRLVGSAVWASYAIPHVAVGVAVVAFALSAARPLYQSLALLIATYTVMFLAQSMASTEDSLLRASPDLEHAARGLGSGPLTTLRRIILPLAKPGLLAGAALIFLSVMKELPATLLLRPNGFETLAVRIWSTTGEGFYTQAATAGLLLLAVSVLPLLAVTRRDISD
jgi:iron(III) transport system permease protein